ncbi:MAG TPA: acetate kinase [Pirellulaceae bacterium]|jgi:acetate kinase
MTILLLNAGSSSLKCTLMRAADRAVIAQGAADWAGGSAKYEYAGPDKNTRTETVAWRSYSDAVKRFIRDLTETEPPALLDKNDIAAVGHRFVHGGPFTSSVEITDEIHDRLKALADLAPLHNPPSLETFEATQQELPGPPHVAVFDTTFHATMPQEAWNYPVPNRWTHEWGLRRYGFHGLSHAYCSRRAAEMIGEPIDQLRLVTCHLGHGCSATAVKHGRSVDTTMGFTPLEGLMMGTRSGSVDPSILLHLMQHHGLTAGDLEQALNHESGLLGVSGVSADMREVLAAADSSNAQAKLALAIYTHRVRQAIGALAVTMGGIDALVFTAGVGEHASHVRASICEGLECLDLSLDAEANAKSRPDADVTRAGSRGRILVIATREDLTMLEEVGRVVGIFGAEPVEA